MVLIGFPFVSFEHLFILSLACNLCLVFTRTDHSGGRCTHQLFSHTLTMENFTDKSSEVIKASFDKAEEMANSQVHPLHLVAVLWDDSPQSLADSQPTLLKGAIERVGGNTVQFNRALLSRINKLPVVDPPPTPPIPLTNSYHAVIKEAQKLKKELADQFVAVDHLLVALIHVDHSEMKDLLKVSGTDAKAMEAELKRKRDGRKVDSRGAESQFEVLTKCEYPFPPRVERECLCVSSRLHRPHRPCRTRQD